ncbi:TPA: hypothetical protein DCE37_25550 [Candidatus Latescibacteria bacterium]|nr:hypothetical protein [Gemmatimonadota bacterium]HAA78479.1 hypothetical protein [Candidatus Latescibacterota bacterium]
MQDFEAKDVQILGCSTDDVAANKKFADNQSFPYPLLCDTEREVCLAFGSCALKEDGAAKRTTFVIGPDGTIAQAIGDVNARENPQQVLDLLS